MGILKNLYRNLGMEANLEQEKDRFIQRINISVLDNAEFFHPYGYDEIFGILRYDMGCPMPKAISTHKSKDIFDLAPSPKISMLTENSFNKTLEALVIVSTLLGPKKKRALKKEIEEDLEKAALDIGIRWQDGMFVLSGEKIFDAKLVDEILDWLGSYPKEKEDYRKALQALLERRYSDVMSECYNAVEGVARKLLGNKKVLENNREALLTRIRLPQEWKAIINSLINIANEYKRHASERRHSATPQEAESFLYLSGLLLRLIMNSEKHGT